MRVVSGHVRDASPTCTRPGIGPEGSVLRSSFRCVTSTPGYRRNLANAALSVIASNCLHFTAQLAGRRSACRPRSARQRQAALRRSAVSNPQAPVCSSAAALAAAFAAPRLLFRFACGARVAANLSGSSSPNARARARAR